MVKTIKLRKWDYRSEREMLQHLNELTEAFRKEANDIVVELTYRFGELDHVFILVNWKRCPEGTKDRSNQKI